MNNYGETLTQIDQSMENLKKGIVGEPVDINKHLEIVNKLEYKHKWIQLEDCEHVLNLPTGCLFDNRTLEESPNSGAVRTKHMNTTFIPGVNFDKENNCWIKIE